MSMKKENIKGGKSMSKTRENINFEGQTTRKTQKLNTHKCKQHEPNRKRGLTRVLRKDVPHKCKIHVLTVLPDEVEPQPILNPYRFLLINL